MTAEHHGDAIVVEGLSKRYIKLEEQAITPEGWLRLPLRGWRARCASGRLARWCC